MHLNFFLIISYIRSPTYTAEGGHSTEVVSIKTLLDDTGFREHTPISSKAMAAFQIISLEESGKLIIWTLIDQQRDYSNHLGLAHWGQVKIPNTFIWSVNF